jgi:hypothetical protein
MDPAGARWVCENTRRVRRMPPSKARQDLQKQVTKEREIMFAREWRTLQVFLEHMPP